MITYFILWGLGLVFTLMKGKWVNHPILYYLDIDLVSILIAYFFLFHGQVAVGVFAFGQGLLMDAMSYGLRGCFTLLYLGVFWAVYLGCRFFDIGEIKGQIIIISTAVFLKNLLFFFLMIVFSLKIDFSWSVIAVSAGSAIMTGCTAPVVFFILNRFRGINFKELRALSERKDALNLNLNF